MVSIDVVSTAASDAWAVAAATPDPELPLLTVADLGILRSVEEADSTVVVTITPTFSGCPAMQEIAADLRSRLQRAGWSGVVVRMQLAPPWTTDWITETGREKLRRAGIAPPGPAGRSAGPVELTLQSAPPAVPCPRCGGLDTERTAEFGATACKSLYRCTTCLEPFEAVKPY
ncbi:MAG TPA: 1,2-phenylacetyl-CoA epoxidase subunit PaaD [Sporichthyaceae bacterium]|jgi:ring-1,2-phenylacetyl-CoA epoxidase subunit PaaD|nr:1,2-phenylacetyl-CoA epoxidase subunit PaaD [Sporichthyaceae bacterium]